MASTKHTIHVEDIGMLVSKDHYFITDRTTGQVVVTFPDDVSF